jgi:hypothetical protein
MMSHADKAVRAGGRDEEKGRGWREGDGMLSGKAEESNLLKEKKKKILLLKNLFTCQVESQNYS